MPRAKLEVELASLPLGKQLIYTKLFAESGTPTLLTIISHDSDSENMVVLGCDRHQYVAFKTLFRSAEQIVQRLKTCEHIMPLTVIDNPMSLEIEVGRLKVMDVSVDVKLSIDRGRGVNIEINSADYDADEYVFIRMSPTDYKRFRNFLKETDSMLNSLHSNRQIAQSFLEE